MSDETDSEEAAAADDDDDTDTDGIGSNAAASGVQLLEPQHEQDSTSMDSRFGALEIEGPPVTPNLVSQGLFWWNFAIGTLIFAVIQVILLWLVFYAGYYVYVNEYIDGEDDPQRAQSATRARVKRLRREAAITTALLSLDAYILYVAATYIQTGVEALLQHAAESSATLTTAQQSEPSHTLRPSNNLNENHVHAQVSRQCDVFLQRCSPVPAKESILVCLLLLGAVICFVFGSASMAEWMFTWTFVARPACAIHTSSMEYKPTTATDMQGIPKALQAWAQQAVPSRRDRDDDSINFNHDADFFVHVNDGATFAATKRPHAAAALSNVRNKNDKVVVATLSDGSLQMLPGIVHPRSLVLLSDRSNANHLNVPGFCCLYDAQDGSTSSSAAAATTTTPSSLSMLCYTGSPDQALLRLGQVRNVTLPHQDVSDDGETWASLRGYENSVWVQMLTDHQGLMTKDFLRMSVQIDNEDTVSTDMQLVPVTHVEARQGSHQWAPIRTEWISCQRARRYCRTAAILLALMLATYWLLFRQERAVGVVPACASVARLASCLDAKLAMTLCIVAAVTAYLSLQGISPCQWKGSERMVWILYTSMYFAVQARIVDMEEFALYLFTAYVVVGSSLGHPSLFLIGWIGGVGMVLAGMVYMFVGYQTAAMSLILIGSIGGAGCVALGRLLFQYRAYITYYSDRMWRAVRSRVPGQTR